MYGKFLFYNGYFFLFVERCPVFNVGAKKLDTMSCLQTRCPPYNYRSNDINVGMYLYVLTIQYTQTTIFCSFFIKKGQKTLGIFSKFLHGLVIARQLSLSHIDVIVIISFFKFTIYRIPLQIYNGNRKVSELYLKVFN